METPFNQYGRKSSLQSAQKKPPSISFSACSEASQIDTKNAFPSEPSMSCAQDQECSKRRKKMADFLDGLETNIILINQSNRFVTYCASDSHAKVAVKVLRQNGEDGKDLERLKNEHRVTCKMSHASIRKSVKLRKFRNSDAIVLEWVEGKTLTECGKLDVKKFLLVAMEILYTVDAMHSNGIMHKNITTDHIILNFDPLQVNIIGFSLSEGIGENKLRNMDQVEKDHSFMSPEETGKVYRTVDYRSDFYNLGVIFYYMLAGKLPFSSENTTDLMNKHIFESPQPLHVVDYSIPEPISDMVEKLMKKNAEDRYQSAKGILYDLQLMSSEYNVDISLGSVVLDEDHFSDRLLFPQKIYGRTTEFHTLLSAFQRVSAGSTEIVFVKGKAGTGKTSIVLELHKYVARRKGFLITGKYDQSQRAEPFSAMCEAFRHFFDSILKGTDRTLQYYKSLIQKAVGDQGKVLTDLIDNLYLIIGKQPNLASAVGENSRNRFCHAFCNLMQALCKENHPIVFILDDLHWADSESLKFLSAFFSTKPSKYLLFIGAYCDDKINETHSLFEQMQKIKDTKVTMSQINISNFSSTDVHDFISDALHLPKLVTLPLTTLVYKKTQGNPFFVEKFLRLLSNKNLLYFSFGEHKWKWDLNTSEVIMNQIENEASLHQNDDICSGQLSKTSPISSETLVLDEQSAAKVSMHSSASFSSSFNTNSNFSSDTNRFISSSDCNRKPVSNNFPPNLDNDENESNTDLFSVRSKDLFGIFSNSNFSSYIDPFISSSDYNKETVSNNFPPNLDNGASESNTDLFSVRSKDLSGIFSCEDASSILKKDMSHPFQLENYEMKISNKDMSSSSALAVDYDHNEESLNSSF